ncbi:MAG: aspartate-semialdehyde dehydrogenase [Planctomycetota bacterium]|nr:MAG: aspartate-semialdehyde dehydrogenase [Planctomycetota bacterium]
MKKDKQTVAIAGVTGAVGQELLAILAKRDYPVGKLLPLASERSAGKTVSFRGEDIPVQVLSQDSFGGVDVAFFSAGSSRSKEFAPSAVEAGALVVDNSSAFRMEPDVPLVVPEVNPEDAKKHSGLIANPNCSTIQMVVAVAPIHRAFGVKRIICATYQAVSGTGKAAMEELDRQVRDIMSGRQPSVEVYPHQIAFNALPHVDFFVEDGYTNEEHKMSRETHKILHDDSIKISTTCVRIPVVRAHSEAVWLELEKPARMDEVRSVLEKSPGVIVVDDPGENKYPMAIHATGRDEVFVGRLRKDTALDNGIAMWVVADQLLKGAALNAVQIAETVLY